MPKFHDNMTSEDVELVFSEAILASDFGSAGGELEYLKDSVRFHEKILTFIIDSMPLSQQRAIFMNFDKFRFDLLEGD